MKATATTLLLAALSLTLLALSAGKVSAHPLTQGALDILVHRDKIVVRARLALEEVLVSNNTRVGADERYSNLTTACANHGDYFLSHFFAIVDGKPLVGKVVSVTGPPAGKSVSPADVPNEFVLYEFEFALASPPEKIEFRQNVLNEVNYLPGNPWEATYVVRITQGERPSREGLLLRSGHPLEFICDWTVSAAQTVVERTPQIDKAGMFGEFCLHGILHILNGWDHLLFVSALVLAAVSFWDLLKVVTAFTLAHTITLSLATLQWIPRIPTGVVEPMIAGSIVAVALWNLFWPEKSSGWARMGVAFFFGLFHGLGFAGGLMDAMQGMSGQVIVLAILSFTLGVEIGHQCIIIPFFLGLKFVRSRPAAEPARIALSKNILRYGSTLITCAGIFYLIGALGFLPEKKDDPPPVKPAVTSDNK